MFPSRQISLFSSISSSHVTVY